MLLALIEKPLPLLHDSNNGLHDNKSLADGMHSLQYPISYASSSTESYNRSLCWLLPAIPIFLPLSFCFSHDIGQPADSLAILLIQIRPDPSSRSFFPPGKKAPDFVLYLGKALPAAIMGLLVVYTFKDIVVLIYPYGLPELIAFLVTVGLHMWKRNMFMSIGAGTVAYMILVQAIFNVTR